MRRTLVWRALLKMGSTADVICTFYCGEKLIWHTKTTQRPVLIFKPQIEFNKTKVHFRCLVPTREHQILVFTAIGWIKPTSTHLRCGHIHQICLDVLNLMRNLLEGNFSFARKNSWSCGFLLKGKFTQKWNLSNLSPSSCSKPVWISFSVEHRRRCFEKGDNQTVDGSHWLP